MKVVEVAVKQLYRFNCPNCGSKLEADASELTDIRGKVSKFFCSVCRKERYVSWRSLRAKRIYEHQ